MISIETWVRMTSLACIWSRDCSQMGRWTVSISSRREETASRRWCLRSGTEMEKSEERVLEVRKLSRDGYFNQSNDQTITFTQ